MTESANLADLLHSLPYLDPEEESTVNVEVTLKGEWWIAIAECRMKTGMTLEEIIENLCCNAEMLTELARVARDAKGGAQ